MSRRNGNELAGEIAIVTGSTRGIGLAIAEELADAGCSVAVVGTKESTAVDVAANLAGSGHAGFSCDISDSEEVQRARACGGGAHREANHPRQQRRNH